MASPRLLHLQNLLRIIMKRVRCLNWSLLSLRKLQRVKFTGRHWNNFLFLIGGVMHAVKSGDWWLVDEALGELAHVAIKAISNLLQGRLDLVHPTLHEIFVLVGEFAS